MLTLIGCGGSGGAPAQSGTVPPVTPPPSVLRHYDGAIQDHKGTLALQSHTVVEYDPATDTVMFQTVMGMVRAGPSRRVVLKGVTYAINFAPDSGILIFSDVIVSPNYSSWGLVLIAANG